jgi:hypothetical protein
MKIYGELKVELHSFLTSELDENRWSASRPAALPPNKGLSLPIGLEAG